MNIRLSNADTSNQDESSWRHLATPSWATEYFRAGAWHPPILLLGASRMQPCVFWAWLRGDKLWSLVSSLATDALSAVVMLATMVDEPCGEEGRDLRRVSRWADDCRVRQRRETQHPTRHCDFREPQVLLAFPSITWDMMLLMFWCLLTTLSCRTAPKFSTEKTPTCFPVWNLITNDATSDSRKCCSSQSCFQPASIAVEPAEGSARTCVACPL